MKLSELPLDEAQVLESPELDGPWLAQRLAWGTVLRSPPLADGSQAGASEEALSWPLMPWATPEQRLVLGDDGQLHMELCVAGPAAAETLEEALDAAKAQYFALKRSFGAPGDEAPELDETAGSELLEQLALRLVQDEELAGALSVEEPLGALILQGNDDEWLACISPAPANDSLCMSLTLADVAGLADLSEGADEAAAAVMQRALALNSAASLGPQVQVAMDSDSGQLLLISPLESDSPGTDGPGPREVKVCLGRLLMLREALLPELHDGATEPPETAAAPWLLRG